MQFVQHKLTVIVDVSLCTSEQTHRSTNSFAHCLLGQLGLEHVFVALDLIISCDGKQVIRVVLQFLQGKAFAGHDAGEILCVRL